MKKSIIILLHAGYWLIYMLLISFLMLALMSSNAAAIKQHFWRNLFFSPFGSSGFVSGILGFYLFYMLLFTKLLRRKKILLLFVFGILGALCCAVVGDALLVLAFGMRVVFVDHWSSAAGITTIMLFISLINGVIALVMRGFITWYGDIKLKEELNRKNYEMELALVKSQINPHFLFNTINNIDVLIEMDAAKASAYLNKLSDIMRFMLYETKTEQIPLQKELGYISKYIELQQLRTANANYVNYHVEGDAGNTMMEPMLFIPFIENAFKHAESKKAENAITIKFAIENGKVVFTCQNSYSAAITVNPGYRGLGNELIKKRLQLLYPGKHTLQVTDENKVYTISLVLLTDGHN